MGGRSGGGCVSSRVLLGLLGLHELDEVAEPIRQLLACASVDEPAFGELASDARDAQSILVEGVGVGRY